MPGKLHHTSQHRLFDMSNVDSWSIEHECSLSTKHFLPIVCLHWSQRQCVWRPLCTEHVVLVADFKLSDCELQPILFIFERRPSMLYRL